MANYRQKQSFVSFAMGLLLLMTFESAATAPVRWFANIKVVTSEGTIQQAMDTCHGWGNGWNLMGPHSMDEDVLVYERMVMELMKITQSSVWTTLRRTSRHGWQNVDGSVYDGEIQLAGKRINMCSLLKLRYEAVKAEACNSQGEGYICQIEDCTHCPYDISPRNCLKLENKCYVLGCDVGGWYDARNTCSRQGFSIISMETKSQLQHIVNWLNKRQHNTCINFWVDLSKASWYYSNIKAPNEAKSTYWYKGEPTPENTCAVLQRFEGGYYWKSVSCVEKHSFICAQEAIRTNESTIEHSTSRLREYDQTKTSVNAQQLLRFNKTKAITNHGEDLFILSVTTLSAILLTAVIILLIGCVLINLLNRKGKKNTERPAGLNSYVNNTTKVEPPCLRALNENSCSS